MRIMVLACAALYSSHGALQFMKYFSLGAALCAAHGCALTRYFRCTEGFPTHSCLTFPKISFPGSQVSAILAPFE